VMHLYFHTRNIYVFFFKLQTDSGSLFYRCTLVKGPISPRRVHQRLLKERDGKLNSRPVDAALPVATSGAATSFPARLAAAAAAAVKSRHLS